MFTTSCRVIYLSPELSGTSPCRRSQRVLALLRDIHILYIYIIKCTYIFQDLFDTCHRWRVIMQPGRRGDCRVLAGRQTVVLMLLFRDSTCCVVGIFLCIRVVCGPAVVCGVWKTRVGRFCCRRLGMRRTGFRDAGSISGSGSDLSILLSPALKHTLLTIPDKFAGWGDRWDQ